MWHYVALYNVSEEKSSNLSTKIRTAPRCLVVASENQPRRGQKAICGGSGLGIGVVEREYLNRKKNDFSPSNAGGVGGPADFPTHQDLRGC